MSRLLRAALAPAMEERSDGRAVKETEFVFYARIVNMEELQQAQSVESHEQWEIQAPKTERNAVSGRLRIRKTDKGDSGNPEFVLTTKTKTADGHSIEVSVPTTHANFVQFQYLSESGMIKDRYVFEIEGSECVWEVDVFKKPDGSYYEWCKIDLEFDAPLEKLPAFPIELADVITNQDGQRTDEEETRVRTLYDYEFITKNRFIA